MNIVELERIHEEADEDVRALTFMRDYGYPVEAELEQAQEREARAWFRLEKARDHASDIEFSF